MKRAGALPRAPLCEAAARRRGPAPRGGGPPLARDRKKKKRGKRGKKSKSQKRRARPDPAMARRSRG